MKKTQKEKVFAYVRKTYGITETRQEKWKPESYVFFHKGEEEKKKLFGILMRVRRDRLGFDDENETYVLNVKCDPELSDILPMSDGFLPAYHMMKKGWISILLEDKVKDKTIYQLIDDSYALTLPKNRNGKKAPRGPKNWLVPANPKYYDVVEAFQTEKVIEWKQSSDVRVGDLVYLYVAVPYSAIMFKTRAVETGIRLDPPDEELNIDTLMRIELLCAYGKDLMPLSRMRNEYGVFAVRGPRYLPNSLKYDLDVWEGKEP